MDDLLESDPKAAIDFAARAVEKSGGDNPTYLLTLAKAQKAGGDIAGNGVGPALPVGGATSSARAAALSTQIASMRAGPAIPRDLSDPARRSLPDSHARLRAMRPARAL